MPILNAVWTKKKQKNNNNKKSEEKASSDESEKNNNNYNSTEWDSQEIINVSAYCCIKWYKRYNIIAVSLFPCNYGPRLNNRSAT